MLAYQWHKDNGLAVVFLHGLLGSQQDWAEIIRLLQKFPEIRPLTLDLCYHGYSQYQSCEDFADQRQQLDCTLKQLLGEQPFWLVGYSLGGRIALDYRLNHNNSSLQGIIVEGANFGLRSETEKQIRWQNDCLWATRFATEPIKNVLVDWYQQAVFADLSPSKRSDFIEKRQRNYGKGIAQMLKATSLAKQPYYGEQIAHFLKTKPNELHFVMGEKDQKFQQLMAQNVLPYQQISQAGHNAHAENPREFVEKLVNIILERNYGTTRLP